MYLFLERSVFSWTPSKRDLRAIELQVPLHILRCYVSYTDQNRHYLSEICGDRKLMTRVFFCFFFLLEHYRYDICCTHLRIYL